MREQIPTTWEEVEAYLRAYHRRNIETQRLGQAYFNALEEAHPEIAELVRGTLADPFYAETRHDPRVERFFDVIKPYFS